MLYSDDVIENVRMHNNIVNVVSNYVKLQKKGKYMFGLCPFHNEKTPSFSVDQEKQIFYCYSCNKGGDVFKFIMDIDNVDFTESLKKLAEQGRVELPESSDERVVERNRIRSRLIEMNTEAAKYYYSTLVSPKGKAGLEYLRRRGLSVNVIRKFGLGYAPSGWDSLFRHLIGKGFLEDELAKGGLVLTKKDGGYIDRFRERIIFPIFDIAGKVIAFGGRVLDNSLPKYVNSPETFAFSKGKGLYGLNFAKKTKEKQLILVEGYLDVITLHANGFDNAVAPLGTALTKPQGGLMKFYASDVIIAFDADTSGRAAALKAIDILKGAGFNITILTVPGGKDPDGFIRERGAQAFRKLISQSMPVVDYKVSLLRDQHLNSGQEGSAFERGYESGRSDSGREGSGREGSESEGGAYERGYDSYGREGSGLEGVAYERGYEGSGRESGAYENVPGVFGQMGSGQLSGKAKFFESVIAVLAEIESEIEREMYVKDISKQYGVSEQAIIAEINKKLGKIEEARPFGIDKRQDERKKAHTAAGAAYEEEIGHGINKDELFIVALLCVDNSLYKLVAERMPIGQYEDDKVREVARFAYDKLKTGGDLHTAEIMRFFSKAEADIYSSILLKECHCESNRKAIEQKLAVINKKKNMKKMIDLIGMRENSGITEEQREKVEAEFRVVMRELKGTGAQTG